MNLFYAQARGGVLSFSNKKAINDYLQTVEGKNLIIRIDLEKGKRSMSQNDWYWGVVLKVIADHTGHTEQELHDLFKRLFLPPEFKKVLGRELKLPRSTTNLNKIDFGEYIEKIRAEVSSMGITIPDPKKDTSIISYPKEKLGESKF